MQVAQGLWFLAAGAIAEVLTPAGTIALSGGLGAAAAGALCLTWYRRRDRHARA
jgi:hypothetical protein